MMNRCIIVLVALFFVTVNLSAYATDLSFEQAKRLWEQSRQNPGFLEYAKKTAEFEGKNELRRKGRCYDVPGGTVRLILIINADGIVECVITDVDNEKANCHKKTFLGVQFPKPPYSPYYDSWVMR